MSNARKVIVYRTNLLTWSETFIREQMLALRGWQAMLVGERLVLGGLSLDGLDARLLPDSGFGRLGRLGRFANRACRYLGWHRLYSPHLAALRAMDADLFHAHFGFGGVDIWPYARALGLPLLVTLHGYDINVKREWWESGRGGPLHRDYPRRLLRMAASPGVHFLAVSEAIRQRAIEYGIPAEKITVSYIGVDTERFRPTGLPLRQRRKRILFVGRMVEKKGPLLMVRAFAQVRERVPDAELVMVGDGPLRAAAVQLAGELNVPVTFAGVLASDQVLRHLQEARVFCLPSMTAENGDAEGLPISILEAQACGVPVVTTTHSGNTEGIMLFKSGFAVREGDAESLSDALRQALESETFLKNASIAARENIISRFSLEDCSKRIGYIYSEFVAHRCKT